MKISVIILCCGKVKFFKDLLGYLKSHSEHLGEVIVCDNSKDNKIADYCEKEKHSFPVPIRVFREPFKPFQLAKMRNIGIDNAECELLCFFDEDIIPVSDDFFDRMVKRHKSNPNLLLVGTRYKEEDTATILTTKNRKPYIIDNYRAKIKKQGRQPWRLMSGGNSSVRKETIGNTRYDEQYNGCWGYEDADFARQLISKGVEIDYDSWLATKHQRHKRHRIGRDVNEKKYLKKWGCL